MCNMYICLEHSCQVFQKVRCDMFSTLSVLRCTGYTEAVGHEADPGTLCLKMHAGHEIAPDQTVSPLHSNFKATCQTQVNNWHSIYIYFLRLGKVSKSTFDQGWREPGSGPRTSK